MLKITQRYYFSPKWLPTLATILLFPILIKLGIWQLHRAEYKRELQAEYDNRSSATPLHLNQLRGDNTRFNYFPIVVTGHFINDRSILLDNKMYQHHPGYQVLTPLLPTNGGPLLLINRGWVPFESTRQKLPVLSPVKGEVTVRGQIFVPPAKTFSLGPNRETISPTWPLRVEQINLTELAKLTGRPLHSFVVLLAPNQPYGFGRDWSPVEMKAYVHQGYAFQWFALAATLLIAFIAVSLHRREIT
jgi:surfeit locus 1 family protein